MCVQNLPVLYDAQSLISLKDLHEFFIGLSPIKRFTFHTSNGEPYFN